MQTSENTPGNQSGATLLFGWMDGPLQRLKSSTLLMIIRVDAVPNFRKHGESSSIPRNPNLCCPVLVLGCSRVPRRRTKERSRIPLLLYQSRLLGSADPYKHSIPTRQSSPSSDLPRCVALRPEAWVALQHRNPSSLYFAKTCFFPLLILA